jgi:2-methylcitrate dehydratase PrpD
LLDWLGCAAAGREQPAALAAAEAGDELAAAAAAGHVLDFDDTWTPGLAHLSAATAPAALFAVAERGGTIAEALAAYATGFETMAALARHGHPAIYGRGLHPTAATGVVGAAAAWHAGSGGRPGALPAALALALTRSGGLLASFGGDGKALGVAGAVVAGRDAARLAAAGASAELDAILAGVCRSWGVKPLPAEALLGAATAGGDAIAQNWIKAYPCCLQTHSAIEAALTVDATRAAPGPLRVRVHPISLEAAAVARPRTGMEAKFSIPYLVAWALLRGRPDVATFAGVDEEVLEASEQLTIEADETLGQSEAVLDRDGYELARITEALGSPSRPMSAAMLEAKLRSLSGAALIGALDDPEAPAAGLLEAAGLTA